ncbi:hypothetical protein C4569_00285 [Candidatus Parcubacteria bacterium]|nr:MAG: hypothetical protein C4569_00285 [Candidatus Parcubacteria bacterium]
MNKEENIIFKNLKEFIILGLWLGFFLFLAAYIKFYKDIDDLGILLAKYIAPLAVFILGGAKATSYNLRQSKKSRQTGDNIFNVSLTYFDLLRHELAAFVCGLVILIMPYFFETEYTWYNVFAAFFSFGVIWWLKKYYFR